MNWQDILGNDWSFTDHGEAVASIDTQGEDLVMPLSHLAQIEVSGDEAADFLQGQVSNDIKQLDESSWQLAAYCNPKGRVLALLYIFRKSGCYHLILPAEVAEATLKRLQMYVLRSKVELHLSDDLLMGVACSSAGKPDKVLPVIPPRPFSLQHAGELCILRIADSPARFMISAAAADISQLWHTAVTTMAVADGKYWRQLDIASGYPQVYEVTREMFIPQMLNLDALNGISFKKGCYPGQEIVARMHYLGKLKKRMYLGTARLASENEITALVPGAPVYSDSFGSQPAGNIVDAIAVARDEYLVTLSAQISGAENNDFHVASNGGVKIDLAALPYSLPGNAKSGTDHAKP